LTQMRHMTVQLTWRVIDENFKGLKRWRPFQFITTRIRHELRILSAPNSHNCWACVPNFGAGVPNICALCTEHLGACLSHIWGLCTQYLRDPCTQHSGACVSNIFGPMYTPNFGPWQWCFNCCNCCCTRRYCVNEAYSLSSPYSL